MWKRWSDGPPPVEVHAVVAAQGPGVVEVIEVEGPPDAPTGVVTAAAGVPCSRAALDLTGVVRLGASVAATLARLHSSGIAHGGIHESHVLVHGGAPVLCGFGAAVLGRPGDADVQIAAAHDVAALGHLLGQLAAETDDHDPLLRQALGRAVERCTRSDPVERPTATALAATLRALSPESGMPFAPLSPTAPATRRRALVAVGAAVAAVVVAVPAVRAVAGAGSADQGMRAAPASSASSATSASPATSRASSAGPHGPKHTSTTDAAVRLWPACEADCRHALRFGEHLVSSADDGDHTLAFDAGCDGSQDPVVVRPATGAVFVFERWPGPGDRVVAAPVARFPLPVDRLSVRTGIDGCPRLIGHTEAGPLPLSVPKP